MTQTVTILQDLPCTGCAERVKRQKGWPDFANFDDVKPLFTRNTTLSRENSGYKSFNALNYF